MKQGKQQARSQAGLLVQTSEETIMIKSKAQIAADAAEKERQEAEAAEEQARIEREQAEAAAAEAKAASDAEKADAEKAAAAEAEKAAAQPAPEAATLVPDPVFFTGKLYVIASEYLACPYKGIRLPKNDLVEINGEDVSPWLKVQFDAGLVRIVNQEQPQE